MAAKRKNADTQARADAWAALATTPKQNAPAPSRRTNSDGGRSPWRRKSPACKGAATSTDAAFKRKKPC